MLGALAPFVLGIVLQVGSAIGMAIVDPRSLKRLAEANREEAKKEFALDVDATQALPSLMIVAAAALGGPGIPAALRGLLVAVALAVGVLVLRLFQRASPNDYDKHSRWWLTPLNQVMIVFNLAACGAVYLTY